MSGMINKSALIKLEEFNDDAMVVKGYASVFNNVDSDSDRLQKGAFGKTLKEWGPEGKNRIKLVSQHNINKPVAKITALKEDLKGLYMEATFGTHTDGVDHYKMVKEGILTEFSIGFVPTKEQKNDFGGNDFTEVKLYEVSLVSVAANDEALVTEVKADDTLKLVKQIEDKELAFKLEREVLKLMSDVPETITEAESDLAIKEDSLEPIVEKEDALLTQLNKLF